MSERDDVVEAAGQMTAAIAARDLGTIRKLLESGTHRCWWTVRLSTNGVGLSIGS
jgi:hypothetical protein